MAGDHEGEEEKARRTHAHCACEDNRLMLKQVQGHHCEES